ncbi:MULTISPECIES: 2-oxo-4-hydroxy-4-carboxy-5-ureidoimidazoline decarboxylase [unclassified Rhodococcus (in: high G+C Gram-positive bacteria)]|uniref:2-oxo-4-hydroxy-4-carboxy-5-ureidoimidazoline decarboxylase n=1 Tax=unclassified Rhodococcus (in: high G+C Gram-positive bacteria) TaxID=192944 RepID=UPI00339B5637
MQYSLADFDELPEDEAVVLLLECCASGSWAHTLSSARPFGSRAAIIAAAERAIAELDGEDLDDALAGHPRIGERANDLSSRREQAAVATADAEVLARIAQGNLAYEEKFGHVYLVRADGRSAAELLAILERRLCNDPDAERNEVRTALADITRLRIERRFVHSPEGTE